MRKLIIAVSLGFALAIMFGAGYFVGRATLERQWRLPPQPISDSDIAKLKAAGVEVVPAPGTKVAPAMPLERARIAMKSFTEKDPIRFVIGSVGRGDGEGGSATVVVKSDVGCEVTSLEGIAYAFDSWGRSATLTEGGAHFLAFATKDEKIAPKAEKKELSFPVKHPGSTSILLAQVDRYDVGRDAAGLLEAYPEDCLGGLVVVQEIAPGVDQEHGNAEVADQLAAEDQLDRHLGVQPRLGFGISLGNRHGASCTIMARIAPGKPPTIPAPGGRSGPPAASPPPGRTAPSP
jgi:hypothetical protein